MMRFLYHYTPGFIKTLAYMLQASEYRAGSYVRWLGRTKDFRHVARRRSLVLTTKSLLLLGILSAIALVCLLLAVGLIIGGMRDGNPWLELAGIVLAIFTPVVTAYAIVVPLKIGEALIQKPKERKIIAEATATIARHPATKIAIAGSFGKTTFKETLATIVGEDKKVAATPGNLNTPLGTSQFARQLNSDEEVIIFELGESHVGDIAELAAITHPDMGAITGINQAHLETFGTIERTVATIFELEQYLGERPLYKNKQSQLVAEHIDAGDPLAYSDQGVNGWKVSDVKTSLKGTKFQLAKGNQTLWVESGLLGKHQIGPLVACIDIAARLGLSMSAIAAGVKKTKPFEHRLEPRQLHGAWIIDDTYNGNIQGVEVGLDFLKGVKAKRKIYVTPGLVEQGSDEAQIHGRIGELVAAVCDEVVLMKNSVTPYIQAGLEAAGFKGKVTLIDDPLGFYASIDQFVASGDVVLMQNDWTDNYA